MRPPYGHTEIISGGKIISCRRKLISISFNHLVEEPFLAQIRFGGQVLAQSAHDLGQRHLQRNVVRGLDERGNGVHALVHTRIGEHGRNH